MTSVIVVERNLVLRDLIVCVLESDLGASVQSADSGAEGQDFMKQRCFDLAIIDACMPKLNGAQLAERAANHNIPALLVTGHPDAAMFLENLDLPYIVKPFRVDQLIVRAIQLVVFKEEITNRIKDSIKQLRVTSDRLSLIMARSKQLVAESRRLVRKSKEQTAGNFNLPDIQLPSVAERLQAFNAGYDAALQNQRPVDCTLSESDPLRVEWLKGWLKHMTKIVEG